MTTNQIAYFKAKVEERHYNNLDAENQRHNLRTEALTAEAQSETQRSNLVREAQNQQNLLEAHRHNVVTEQQTWQNLALTEQYNASIIALNEATTTLRNLESEQRALDLNLDEKYKEYERLFGTGNNSKPTVASTVSTVLKVAEYGKDNPYQGLPSKGSGGSKVADAPKTKQITPAQQYQITFSRITNAKKNSTTTAPRQVVRVGYH